MKKLLLILFISIQTLFSYSQCAELFISEYIEGGSNNKVIELYNPTTVAAPLSTFGYQIRVYSNGAASPSFTIGLTGTIPAGGTYILCHTSADASVLAIADQTSGSLQHNGNDAVELFRTFDGASIDIVGQIGVDPGTQWLLNGVAGTQNKTLVRKQTIQQPNLVWTGSCELEWDIFPQDDFTHLDAHTMNACGPTPLATDFTFSNVCFGTIASFNSTTTGGDGNYTYAWDFGDGTGTSTQEDPTYMYASAGTYTVNLVVTDGTPTVTTASYTITIYDKPIVTSTPDNASVCLGNQICFTTNVSGGTPTFNYLWDYADGGNSTQQNPCYTYVSPGTYATVLIVTDQNGCKDTVNNNLSVNPLDDASFNYSSTSYCINDGNQSVTISGLTGGTFSGSAGVDASTGELNLVNAGAGTHNITYTTNGACPNSSMVTISIMGPADATITAAGPFCESDASVNLTAVDGGGTWSGTGIISASNGTFDPSIAGAGSHVITYTISGSCGDTQTETIVVNANDVLSIYNNDTTICNDIFGFFLNAEAGGTWSGVNVNDSGSGDGFFSSAAITPGTYYAVYSTSSTCPFEDSIQIDVYDYPVANFSFSSTLGDVNFTDLSTNAVTYYWDFDDGNNSTAQNPIHTFAINGTYNVCLTVTNSVGCENTTCQTVTINGLGIEKNSIVDFKVYPNPSNGNLTIESNSNITKISVKDLIGQTVFNKNTNATTSRISLEEINSGFYFIEIETEKGKAIKRIEIIR